MGGKAGTFTRNRLIRTSLRDADLIVLWRVPVTLWDESLSYASMPAHAVELGITLFGLLPIVAPNDGICAIHVWKSNAKAVPDRRPRDRVPRTDVVANALKAYLASWRRVIG